jgi:hypothetical protein
LTGCTLQFSPITAASFYFWIELANWCCEVKIALQTLLQLIQNILALRKPN